MQFTFTLDIQSIIDKTMAPENIQPVLEKAIAKSFSSAVDDATGYLSEFQEQLKQQLKQALPHGLSIDDVAKFQFLLNSDLSSMATQANQETINTAIKKVMPDVPARIKLSELVDAARDGLHKKKHEDFYARREDTGYGTSHIYFDGDSGCSHDYYRAEIQLAVNERGDVYTLKMNNTVVTPAKLPQAISKFDGLLLSLYVGRTTLELDIDADDVAAAAEAQYED